MDQTLNNREDSRVRDTVRSVTATAVLVPIKRPLATSASRSIDAVPFLLVDLLTEGGVVGRGYAFCYHAAIARSLHSVVLDLDGLLKGKPLAPLDIARVISMYFRLPGLAGPMTMVASAIDTAAWDALAQTAGMPLATYLGASPRALRAYNSNGLGLLEPEAIADECDALLHDGLRAMKMRLGRGDVAKDLRAVRAARSRLPDDVLLMADFNQALTFGEALRYVDALDGEGLYWIEEPIRHDDYHHMKLVSDAAKTLTQWGENFTGLGPMAAALEARASDLVMLDLDRIGGVTGWLSAAGLAAAYGREVSSHLFPEVSAHLMPATAGQHWLEYVDWAEPLLTDPLKISGGEIVVPTRPGNGLRWNADAVQKYQLL